MVHLCTSRLSFVVIERTPPLAQEPRYRMTYKQKPEPWNQTRRVLMIHLGWFMLVNGLSFGVGRDTIFAMLGPNGAGKTTAFNIIRGQLTPNNGDAFLNGMSITMRSSRARVSLGVCPQFTAIDSQLSVREHLVVYGRLKGLRGEDLKKDIAVLMKATELWRYRDMLASKLSGGNQRKLALVIAMIGVCSRSSVRGGC